MKVEQRLSDFKREAYLNAVRLFRDSALLYTHDAYPSAYAIAVTAFEEIGKVHVIDRGCDAMCMNPDNAEALYETYFDSGWTTNHKHKQRWAFVDALEALPSQENPAWRYIDSGGLEYARQQALYVEMSKKKVEAPLRINSAKAFDQLSKCRDAIAGTGDLGFNGFAAEPTSKSEWLTNQAMDEVNAAFERCVAYNKTR